MSGIYIPDMKMPTGCASCDLANYFSDGEPYCRRLMRRVVKHDARLDNCPLVAVPDHGRLIDADALTKMLYFYFEKSGGRDTLEALIKTEPTIIPADKEDGDG